MTMVVISHIFIADHISPLWILILQIRNRLDWDLQSSLAANHRHWPRLCDAQADPSHRRLPCLTFSRVGLASTQCINSASIGNNKGVNLPDAKVRTPPLNVFFGGVCAFGRRGSSKFHCNSGSFNPYAGLFCAIANSIFIGDI